MADESVEILIEADDKASGALAEVRKEAEKATAAAVKGFKETGGQAKASTELVGTLANALGGTEIGSYASQIAGLTDKVAAFSEVAKAGATGALAIKGALVGITAVAAFKIGEAIGNAVFQTDKWKKELEEARIQAEKLDEALLKATARRGSQTLEEISLIRDPDEQVAATKQALEQIENEIIGKQRQITEKLAGEEDFNTAWFGSPEDRAKAKDTSAEQAHLDLLKEQRDTLRETISERKASVEAQKALNAAQDKSDSYLQTLREQVELLAAKTDAERNAIEAARNTTDGDEAEAKRLLAERDALTAKAEAEKAAAEEKKKLIAEGLAAEKAAANERLRNEKEWQKFRENENIQAARDEVAKLKEDAKGPGQLDATQGRLLTRGGEDSSKAIADNTAKAASQLEAANKRLDDLIEAQKRPAGKEPIALELVS